MHGFILGGAAGREGLERVSPQRVEGRRDAYKGNGRV
jgi:hypothetical protein